MAWRVNKIQLVHFTILFPVDGDRPGFDRDAALTLDIQIVKNLRTKLSLRDRATFQQQLVCESALAVVDVGNDAEIANELRVHKYTNRDSESGSQSNGD